MIKKVAVLTSGGDAPGMNNAIVAIVKSANFEGIKPFLVYEGYKGLHKGAIVPAVDVALNQYTKSGGTVIFTSRYPAFFDAKVRQEAKEELAKLGIDALVVIGGDGSYRAAQLLHEIGVKTIALPGTIDNDIPSSDITIGYDTALNTIVENVDRLRDTMRSHHKIAIIEVMGHGNGDLALYGGIASNAEIIVTNDNALTIEQIGQSAKEMFANGHKSVLVIVSEFIYDDLWKVAKQVEKIAGKEARAIKFSHIQRGGSPTAMERVNATLMGMKAIELLKKNKSGLAVGVQNGEVVATPIPEALKAKRDNSKELAEKMNKISKNKSNQLL